MEDSTEAAPNPAAPIATEEGTVSAEPIAEQEERRESVPQQVPPVPAAFQADESTQKRQSLAQALPATGGEEAAFDGTNLSQAHEAAQKRQSLAQAPRPSGVEESASDGNESDVPKYIAEFVGTYILVFTVGCNVLAKKADGEANMAGLSIGAVLMVSIYALGGVSGANFNPAVSFALGLSEKLPWKDVAIYSIVQVLAGILAACSYGLLLGEVFNLEPQKFKIGNEDVQFGFKEIFLAEFLYTFMLCFVVLNTAAAKKNTPNQFYGLSIGFVIVAGAYGAGTISGGCFNPAVALGIDVSSASKGLQWGPIYSIIELTGAAFAAALFRVVRPDDYGGSPDYGLLPRLVSEFLGTYILVLTVGLNILANSDAAVLSIAASLMSMIFALGNCSGAHFNPAVTLAIVMSGRDKCSPADAGAYMGVQIIAGICAGMTYSAMFFGHAVALNFGEAAPKDVTRVAMAEVIATFVLCFVVLSVATVRNVLTQYFGLAIGACVISGGLAIGKISGGSLNPAVSIGLGVSYTALDNSVTGIPGNICLWSASELIGGALAACVFRVVQPGEYTKSSSIMRGRGHGRYGSM